MCNRFLAFIVYISFLVNGECIIIEYDLTFHTYITLIIGRYINHIYILKNRNLENLHRVNFLNWQLRLTLHLSLILCNQLF